MMTFKFSGLPIEIQVSIGKVCENDTLINLCATAKWMNAIFLPVLYRNVDLELDRLGPALTFKAEFRQMLHGSRRQQKLVRTLLKYPEYGKYVRSFKGTLLVPDFDIRPTRDQDLENDMIWDQDLWRAMQSLTRVRRVEIGCQNDFVYRMAERLEKIPNDLFRSARSVKLVGHMQYDLAKAILSAVNPATLSYLCLDMVQDRKIEFYERGLVPGDETDDGRMIAYGATLGLLRSLTGLCTALRTLILRRIGQSQENDEWHSGAEEASYTEWSSFIHSVMGTLERFKFEQVQKLIRGMRFPHETRPFRIMDERFGRLIFPIICSKDWACLTMIELRGVRSPYAQGGKTGMTEKLKAVLGEDTKIVVKS